VAAAAGRLPGQAFDYDASQDVFRCPGGQTLPPHGKPKLKNGVHRQCYASKARVCKGCALRDQCLPEKGAIRRIYRSEHAAAVARHRQHMQGAGAVMRERAGLCEHPFGTLKRWLGWDHFLVRGLTMRWSNGSGHLNLVGGSPRATPSQRNGTYRPGIPLFDQ